MGASVTAVTLSPVPLNWPGLVHVSTFDDARGYYRARLDALRKVKTEWFYWLDSDDELTPQADEALHIGMKSGQPLVYTDEVVRENGTERVIQREPYDTSKHLQSAMFTHHLCMYRTEDALKAAKLMPEAGEYQPNVLLSYIVAKGGALHVPIPAYVWNKGQGLHRKASFVIAQMRSLLWCKGH
jgi:glycosyltransferase involved in cell wall biosynthesis